MCIGMIHPLHTTAEQFFKEAHHLDFEQMITYHSQQCILQAYPSPHYMNYKLADEVVVVPWQPSGHPVQRIAKTALLHNPALEELQQLTHFERFHLLAIASYLILDIDRNKCPLRDYLLTFGYTCHSRVDP